MYAPLNGTVSEGKKKYETQVVGLERTTPPFEFHTLCPCYRYLHCLVELNHGQVGTYYSQTWEFAQKP